MSDQNESERKQHSIVVGVGPGTGLACVHRLIEAGHTVSMIARHAGRLESWQKEIPGTVGYAVDIADLDAFRATLGRMVDEHGLPEIVVYNATLANFGRLTEIEAEKFERSFRVNATGLLTLAQELLPPMAERGDGALVITGNTGSQRGRPEYVGWSPTKAAQRILAECLAREYGPLGVHVAYVIIDAVIDMPFARRRRPDRPDDFYAKPADLADQIYRIATQPRSARTFLTELRPFGEVW